ncbi:MAG: hypothetical protein RLZ77_953, partial [Bacteroidota bacterium]
FYNQSLTYCSDTTPNWTAYSQIEMAKIQNQFGDYHSADSVLTQTLKLDTEPIYRRNASIALANSYTHLENYAPAIAVYQQCLPQLTNVEDRLIVQNNLGYVYSKAQQFSKAMELFGRLKNERALDTLPQTKAMIYDNWGIIALKLKHNGGKAALDTGYRLRDSLQNKQGLTSSAMHYAHYYQLQNQKDSILFWAKKAYNYAQQCHNPEDRLEALQYAINAADAKDAKMYMRTFLQLSDSLQHAKAQAKAQFTSILYDAKKEKKENAQFRGWIISLVGLLVLLIVLSVITTYILRLRARQRELQAVYATELRLSKQLHDELANDVFKTLSFVENQTPDSPNKEAVLDHLEEIYQRTRFLSRSTGAIETGLTFKEELLELMSGFSSATVAVIALNVERIDWNSLAPTSKITLYRVLQELLVNMKKHSGANRVQITFEANSSALMVQYEDNGIGMPTAVHPKNGLVNVENRILTLGGSISFETHQPTGCALKFILPK